MKLDVLSLNNSAISNIEVQDYVFSVEQYNNFVVSLVVRWQLLKKKTNFSKVKTRSEVRGGRRKIYKQKGTGQARHSDKYAPQFRSGGVAHGPKNIKRKVSVPKKIRILALRNILAQKVQMNALIVFDNFSLDSFSTKKIASITSKYFSKKVLFIDSASNLQLCKSVANLENANFLAVEGINVLSLIKSEVILISSDAVRVLEKRLMKYHG